MQEPGAASTSGPEGAIALVSPAWLRHGPKGMFGAVEPGLLIAREGGSISFVTQREKVFEAEMPLPWKDIALPSMNWLPSRPTRRDTSSALATMRSTSRQFPR